jgi:hypothetical protein
MLYIMTNAINHPRHNVLPRCPVTTYVKRPNLSGECVYCKKAYPPAYFGRHLQSCEKRKEQMRKGQAHKTLILSVKGRGVTGYTYWMFVEVNPRLTLRALDAFLRRHWVECCGHLSQFIINGIHYIVYGAQDLGGKSMRYRLANVLQEGVEFLYEYDFGTTTSLTLKAVKVDDGLEESIGILAINDAPQLPCDACGKKPATQICSECLWDGEKAAFFCDTCMEEHEHEELLLPLVNSPRTGLCGYTG